MIIQKTYNFKIKNFKLIIKRISDSNINQKYLLSLKKSNYILHKNKNVILQKKYINKINSAKSKMILGFFHNNELVATSGFQNLQKKLVSVGIFIFGEKFLNKKVSHLFIANACIFVNKQLKKEKFKAGFDKNNIKSILSFKKIGFETYLKKKKTILKKTTIQKIKYKIKSKLNY